MINDLMEALEDGYLEVQLSQEEVTILMEVLNFSIMSAKMLAEQELVKGTYQGSNRMNAIAHQASKLLDIIIATAQIGSIDGDLAN